MLKKTAISVFVLLGLLILSIQIFGNGVSVDTVNGYLDDAIKIAWNLSSSDADSAAKIVDRAYNVAQYYDSKKEIAELIRIKGIINLYKVNYAKALDYFLESRALFQKIGDRSGEASALNNISVVYRRQAFYEEVLGMDTTVLNMRIEIGDSSKIAASLNNVAVSYNDIGDIAKALKYYQKAVKMSMDINEIESIDLVFNNIGVIYLNLNQYDSAYFYFNKSLAISKKFNNKQILSNAYTNLGNYYIKLGETKQAINFLKEGLRIAQEIEIVYEIESVAEQLHEAYALVGDYKNAYKIHRLLKQMSDSANNLQTMQKITELETQAKFDKEQKLQQLLQEKIDIKKEIELSKQKQIRNIAWLFVLTTMVMLFVLYRNYKKKSVLYKSLMVHRDEVIAQKEEIESQRDEIEELNNTKDKFFTIIAHDLKNPISGIYQLSGIMKDRFDFTETEKLKEYVSQIHLSTQKSYELLENLLSWARVQTGSIKLNITDFNLTHLIQENIALLSENMKQKKIQVSFDTCNDCNAIADEEMINTVIRNLLHNAIKFSPEQGKISFKIELHNKFWIVSVHNSGKEISKPDLLKLFKLGNNKFLESKSKEKGTGLGLVLCKEFIELHKGKIWAESEFNKGTTFFIQVPAKKM